MIDLGHRSRAAFGIALGLLSLPAPEANGAFREWSDRDGNALIEAGELEAFDFQAKEIVCRDRIGGEHRLPTDRLGIGSRMQLLLAPEFLQSLPRGGISPEQGYYILLAVTVPAGFLLVSFFLSALILTRSFNPIRAVIGWCGSVILGAFLVGFYVILSARSPGAAGGITIFGILMVTGLLSLYVSVIYRTTTLKGFKILALHVFGAIFLILIAVLSVKFGFEPDGTEKFLEDNVFRPVGLI